MSKYVKRNIIRKPIPCKCGCGKMVKFDNPNNHNGKFATRECAVAFHRKYVSEYKKNKKQRIPKMVRGCTFKIVKVPDPEALFEEDRLFNWETTVSMLNLGQFYPGTKLKANGINLIILGELDTPQRMIVRR